MMALLTPDRVFLHDANDLEVFERFWSADRAEDDSVRGEIQQAASGRLRTIVRVGEKKVMPVTLRDVTEDQLAWLRERKGALLLYRDHRGRFLFGSYFGVTPKEHKDGTYDVPITFQQTTRTIEV
jgi:hypothetical protein